MTARWLVAAVVTILVSLAAGALLGQVIANLAHDMAHYGEWKG